MERRVRNGIGRAMRKVVVVAALALVTKPWVAGGTVLSPGATGCVIYREGAYESDNKFRLVEYRSFDDFRTGTTVRTLSGEVLRLTPGHRPLFIPYPSHGAADPAEAKRRIAEAKERFPHLGMDIARVEQAWETQRLQSSRSMTSAQQQEDTEGKHTLVLTDGRTLEEWSIMGVADRKVKIMHSTGIITVPIELLPEEVVQGDGRLVEGMKQKASDESAAGGESAVGAWGKEGMEQKALDESVDRGMEDALSAHPADTIDDPNRLLAAFDLASKDKLAKLAAEIDAALAEKKETEAKFELVAKQRDGMSEEIAALRADIARFPENVRDALVAREFVVVSRLNDPSYSSLAGFGTHVYRIILGEQRALLVTSKHEFRSAGTASLPIIRVARSMPVLDESGFQIPVFREASQGDAAAFGSERGKIERLNALVSESESESGFESFLQLRRALEDHDSALKRLEDKRVVLEYAFQEFRRLCVPPSVLLSPKLKGFGFVAKWGNLSWSSDSELAGALEQADVDRVFELAKKSISWVRNDRSGVDSIMRDLKRFLTVLSPRMLGDKCEIRGVFWPARGGKIVRPFDIRPSDVHSSKTGFVFELPAYSGAALLFADVPDARPIAPHRWRELEKEFEESSKGVDQRVRLGELTENEGNEARERDFQKFQQKFMLDIMQQF